MKLVNKLFIGAGLLFLVLAFFCYNEASLILNTEATSWTTPVSADCAIVLTGSDGRIQKGLDLLAQKRVKKVIISGVFKGSTFREIFPQWPFYPEISEDDVILEKRSQTTYGNANQSLPLAEALNCRDIVLVTSTLHTRRALRLFKYTFPENTTIYTYSVVSGDYTPDFWPLAIEVIKSLFYSVWAY